MNEQLIDEITKEVFRRLQAVELSNQNSKKTMLVISEGSYPIPDYIRRDYQIIVTGSISSLQISNIYSMVEAADCILITSLSTTQLANLALGCGECGLLEGIRYALLLGKTIFALEEGLSYRAYRKSAHKTYYRRLFEYEECIKSYGIQILEQGMKMPVGIIHDPNVVQEITCKDDNCTIDKRLVLEKDLMNLKSQTAVWVGKNSIVTPCAQDYARAHHIQIIKK